MTSHTNGVATSNGTYVDSRNGKGTSAGLSYENANIDEIMYRQLNEDILAYRHDLSFCTEQLAAADLTPQEMRTLQLRTLDLGHQIRHCQHRAEILQIQIRNRGGGNVGTHQLHSWVAANNHSASHANGSGARRRSSGNTASQGTLKRPAPATMSPVLGKRPRMQQPNVGNNGRHHTNETHDGQHGHADEKHKIEDQETDENDDLLTPDSDDDNSNEPITNLQRLGYWKCRLCRTPKYLQAGSGRAPAAPCKWPLKDVAKMIAHFTEMHPEHRPDERCAELGAALRRNRGPFEYWLRCSRSQNLGEDGAVVDRCVSELLAGRLPDLLRRLSRAAANFPAA
ncbi:hypothetical protein VTK73DRAFT_10337 [Phialemonium thermophilum]|uniref:Uncharacterized protein n=1 Tax=Phialemonium thermophilum TaxID=223376 RepID=A0ABR3VX83_9PEZI